MQKSPHQLLGRDIYRVKNNKKPDHLVSLIHRLSKNQENIEASSDATQFSPKLIALQQLCRKQTYNHKINSILKMSLKLKKVSDPVPFKCKKWVSPLLKDSEESSLPLRGVECNESTPAQPESKPILKKYYINEHLRHFGDYLQVKTEQCRKKVTSKLKGSSNQLKVAYISNKFALLQEKLPPKLCIMKYSKQKELTFINHLQNDEFYQKLIQKQDKQLAELMQSSLMPDGQFTKSVLALFYDIFVWQCATKQQQIHFVVNLLMGNREEIPLFLISNMIDLITQKHTAKTLDNFAETIKKLIFQDDYDDNLNLRKDCSISRKKLSGSLQANQEIISILINTFYAL